KEEERRTSGSGKDRKTSWETVRTETEYGRAFLSQGGLEVEIDLPRARFEYLEKETQRSGNRRYTLTYLPKVGRASVCGLAIALSEHRPDDAADVPGAHDPAHLI